MPDEFEQVEIARKELADVRFNGRLLARIDSKGSIEGRDKQRWTELAVWELPSGKWVAASIGCSDKAHEIDIGDVEVIEKAETNVMRLLAMQFWGWTWLAKDLAEKAGWDVTVEFA